MKTHFEINLKEATLDDCKTLYQWQINPDIRKYARNTNPITWEEHSTWYKKTLASDKSLLFIIETKNTPVGMLRFDKVTKLSTPMWEVSILVDTDHQGKSIGLKALEKIPSIFNSETIYAKVKQENLSSQRLFVKAGFTKVSTTAFVLDVKKL